MRNLDSKFAGLPKLIAQHQKQVAMFEDWAAAQSWSSFHEAHYDWWAFPINQPSSRAWQWTVLDGDVRELQANPEFIMRLKAGIRLLGAAWGWDTENSTVCQQCSAHQRWQNWPIRLWKATLCAALFGLEQVTSPIKAERAVV